MDQLSCITKTRSEFSSCAWLKGLRCPSHTEHPILRDTWLRNEVSKWRHSPEMCYKILLPNKDCQCFRRWNFFQPSFWFSKHFTEIFQASSHRPLSIKGNNYQLKKFSRINQVENPLSKSQSKSPHIFKLFFLQLKGFIGHQTSWTSLALEPDKWKSKFSQPWENLGLQGKLSRVELIVETRSFSLAKEGRKWAMT